jgi:hypothetical protein
MSSNSDPVKNSRKRYSYCSVCRMGASAERQPAAIKVAFLHGYVKGFSSDALEPAPSTSPITAGANPRLSRKRYNRALKTLLIPECPCRRIFLTSTRRQSSTWVQWLKCSPTAAVTSASAKPFFPARARCVKDHILFAADKRHNSGRTDHRPDSACAHTQRWLAQFAALRTRAARAWRPAPHDCDRAFQAAAAQCANIFSQRIESPNAFHGIGFFRVAVLMVWDVD